MTEILLVAFGAALGAPVRFLTDRSVQTRHSTSFPFGTMTVNLAACLVLGFLAGLGGSVSMPWTTFLGIGFCGALSTYSTFAYESVRLVELRARILAGLYVTVSVVGGVALIELGRAIAVL